MVQKDECTILHNKLVNHCLTTVSSRTTAITLPTERFWESDKEKVKCDKSHKKSELVAIFFFAGTLAPALASSFFYLDAPRCALLHTTVQHLTTYDLQINES